MVVVVPKGVREMKLKEGAWANASAIMMGIIYVACAGAVSLFPALFRTLSRSWFHGIDMDLIWTGTVRPNFLLGLISAMVLSWIAGWLFAWLYNRFTK